MNHSTLRKGMLHKAAEGGEPRPGATTGDEGVGEGDLGVGEEGGGGSRGEGAGGVGSGEGPQSPGSQILSSSQSGMAVAACPGTRTCASRCPTRAASSASRCRRLYFTWDVAAASTFIVTRAAWVPSCCSLRELFLGFFVAAYWLSHGSMLGSARTRPSSSTAAQRRRHDGSGRGWIP